MRSMIFEWFSSNQSLCLLIDGPKHSIVVLYIVSWRVIHTASTSCLPQRMVSSYSSKASTNDCLVEMSFSFMMFSRFWAFLPCGLVLGCTLKLSLEMIRRWSRPAFCTTHSLCDFHIPPISPSYNDIVDQMPVLRVGEWPIVHWKIFLTEIYMNMDICCFSVLLYIYIYIYNDSLSPGNIFHLT